MTEALIAAASAAPASARPPVRRAAVIDGPRSVRIEEGPAPEPGPGEVRVCLEGCGVCTSNLPVWEGRPWFSYPQEPGAPGHEGWGRIDAVGEGVSGLAVGQRVAMLSYHAYATHDVAPADSVVPLPDALAGVPVPGEPLGCALNIFERAGIRAGQTVAIIGIGFLGALLVRLAADAGARVIALARRPFALDLARRYGAHEPVAMDDHWRVIEHVKNLTDGRFCDVVVEATGKQWPLDLAGELTAERGRLVVAGYHQDGMRQVNMQLWNWRGIDVINAHEREAWRYIAGIRSAVDALAAGRIDPGPLYTHTFPLERLGEALDLIAERPDGFVKALIRIEPA